MIKRSVALGITGSLLSAAVWLAGTAPASADGTSADDGLLGVLSSTRDAGVLSDTTGSLLAGLNDTLRMLLTAQRDRTSVPVIGLDPAKPSEPAAAKPADEPSTPDTPKQSDRTRDAKKASDDSDPVAAQPVVTIQPESATEAAAETEAVAKTAARLPASELGPVVQAPARDSRSSVTQSNVDRALSMPLHPVEQPASLPLVLAIVTLAASAALLARRWVLKSHV